ncbi:MAG: endolytic transglycosylase MltG [Bacteroidales bacterium]|nr:endolytic transglycosylase MltG [Bacteroidales bacterium]
MIAGKKTYILIAAGVAVLGLLFSVMAFRTFFMSNITGEGSYLYIPHNAGYDQLSDSLKKSGSIKSMSCFKRAAGFEGLEKEIKPGMYHLKPGMSNHQIIRIIKHGWQTPVRITLSGNIRNMEKLASLLSRKIESDSTQILAILKDSSLVDSLGFNNFTFPSMFLLDTYEVYWTIKPKELLLRFKKEYDKFWNGERMEKAGKIGLSAMEVSTLASIVSEESNMKEEQPVIAGVYLNRLWKKMPLQADPTIKFILNDPSVKRILNRHLSIDSPYNTYKHAGLPPGPIVIPQKSTIDAVLNFKKHNYIYFCAKPTLDGSHNFAVTLAEHNKNARAYQRAISRL